MSAPTAGKTRRNGTSATSLDSPFPPIADYGFLSDCHTGALVASVPTGASPVPPESDDENKKKDKARTMIRMTDAINSKYLAELGTEPGKEPPPPVTCGTCHQGHLGPEPYKIPKEDHDHDHDGPSPAGGAAPAK